MGLLTWSTIDTPHPSDLPDLQYPIQTKRKYIIIFWSLMVFTTCLVPIALYYGLTYGTHLTHREIFGIATSVFGTASGVQQIRRDYRLRKKNSTCRPPGVGRNGYDWFHWIYTIGSLLSCVELVLSTTLSHAPVRLISMTLPTLVFAFSMDLLIIDTLRHFNVPAPFRRSSTTRGSPLTPGIYPLIEDIVAVDGSGGVEYRERLKARYDASQAFREMLSRLSLFWGLGGFGMAGITTIIIFTVPEAVAYGFGWAVPHIWAIIWALITVGWVRDGLRQEKENWKFRSANGF